MKNILFLVSCSLLLISCGRKQALEFEQNSGKVNTVKAGESFYINLPEDHKTGNTWSLNDQYDDKIISYQNSVYHSTNNGSVDFNFEALKPGSTEIKLVLRMHTDTAMTKTFKVDVK